MAGQRAIFRAPRGVFRRGANPVADPLPSPGGSRCRHKAPITGKPAGIDAMRCPMWLHYRESGPMTVPHCCYPWWRVSARLQGVAGSGSAGPSVALLATERRDAEHSIRGTAGCAGSARGRSRMGLACALINKRISHQVWQLYPRSYPHRGWPGSRRPDRMQSHTKYICFRIFSGTVRS